MHTGGEEKRSNTFTDELSFAVGNYNFNVQLYRVAKCTHVLTLVDVRLSIPGRY